MQLPEAVVVLEKASETLAWELPSPSACQPICHEEALVTQVVVVDPEGLVEVAACCQQVLALVTKAKSKFVPSAVLVPRPRAEGEVVRGPHPIDGDLLWPHQTLAVAVLGVGRQ